jgi:ABC-type phosphate transport system substrate-binding protein
MPMLEEIRVTTERLSPLGTPMRAITFVATLALGSLMLTVAVARADDITLVETGSSLLYPLFNVWATQYMKTHTDVHIITNSTDSAIGVEQAISGKVHIGASDAYLSDEQVRQYPHVINVPMAISALTVNYNIPGLNSAALKLDGPVLAGIYSGKIRAWDDAAIAQKVEETPYSIAYVGVSFHAEVAKAQLGTLPHHDIIPVHRADGSGDTFVFTQYLTYSVRPWDPFLGSGLSIAWPAVPGSLTATDNFGVLHRAAKELFRRVPVADTGDDDGCGTIADPPNAGRPALLFGERTRRTLLSADQLRVRDRLDKAGDTRDRQGTQEIFALGHRAS